MQEPTIQEALAEVTKILAPVLTQHLPRDSFSFTLNDDSQLISLIFTPITAMLTPTTRNNTIAFKKFTAAFRVMRLPLTFKVTTAIVHQGQHLIHCEIPNIKLADLPSTVPQIIAAYTLSMGWIIKRFFESTYEQLKNFKDYKMLSIIKPDLANGTIINGDYFMMPLATDGVRQIFVCYNPIETRFTITLHPQDPDDPHPKALALFHHPAHTTKNELFDKPALIAGNIHRYDDYLYKKGLPKP